MPSEQAVESIEKPLRELRNQFVALTSPHRTPLWNYCLKLTGSPWDAEDLVQETMMKAFARLALLGQAVNVKAYLFRIASNTWIDQLRRTKMIAEEVDVAMEVADEQPAGQTAKAHEAMEILVSILPPRQRIIYLLIELFDFKPSEVATMIDTTEGAVKAALHRARATIQARSLQEEHISRARTGLKPPSTLIEEYVKAFDKRDPEALVALLKHEVVNEIVGDWEEHGIEMMKKSSLYYWSLEQDQLWVEYGMLFGRPVLFGFRKTEEHEKALSEIIGIEVVDGKIVSQKWYFFCPELIEYTAHLLGVPAKTWGYTFDSLTQSEST